MTCAYHVVKYWPAKPYKHKNNYMKASSIADQEQDFAVSKTDADGKLFDLAPFSVDMPGDPAGTLNAVDCTRHDGDTSYYFTELVEKKRIVVHFTEGFLKGDLFTLTQTGNHVSVPFLIARDGTIYNLWASKNWSYHVGPKAVGGNQTISSSSVAIELSNIGPLTLKGNELWGADNAFVYCTLDETDFYTELPQVYRGYSYYATFTTAQYTSLITLLRFLTTKYNIPRSFLPEDSRYNLFGSDADAQASTGIVTHVNFRPSGEKVDIGPAFDWDTVIAGVTA